MLRIGLLLDSRRSTAWVAHIVAQIQSSDCARIELVVLNGAAVPRPPLRRRLPTALFRLYESLDARLNRRHPNALAPADLAPLLDGIPAFTAQTLRSPSDDSIPETDLERIRSARLDLLFRFGFRILRGDILSAARLGVWSFHHGDNRSHRGGPALFWELCHAEPLSGVLLQRLTEELDAGHVLERGIAATNIFSLHRNRNANYWKAADFALRQLRRLERDGSPSLLPREPVAPRIERAPSNFQMLAFSVHLAGRCLRHCARNTLHGPGQHWFLALRPRSPQTPFHSGSGYIPFLPPPGHFYADPNLVEENGRAWLFFEDFPLADGLGRIACCSLSPDGTPGKPFTVLRRPHHLSYPFVFQHSGDWFLIPETRANRTVELYRARSFPSDWQLETVLLRDLHAVDATLHVHDGLFWLFAGLSTDRYSANEELALFHAPTLTGPWTPHPRNPVVEDVRSARPAGRLFLDAGRLVRPAQNSCHTYGHHIEFRQILTLDPGSYAEQPLATLLPNWIAGNRGTHTYTASHRFEAIDGYLPPRLFPAWAVSHRHLPLA